MKLILLGVAAAIAWVALAVFFALAYPTPKPKPPVAWCWVSVPGFMYGEPCKYRKREFSV